MTFLPVFIISVISLILILEIIFGIFAIQENKKLTKKFNDIIDSLSTDENITPETPSHLDSRDDEAFPKDSDSYTAIPHDADKERVEREDYNRESLCTVLRDIGCNPQIKEDGDIRVGYQGENFLIQFNGAFIRIWDLSWYVTKSTNDEFTLLKDAANYANFSFGPTIIMHSPDEDGKIVMSSRFDVLYNSDFSDNNRYIISVLDAFFAIKHYLQREVSRLRQDPLGRTIMENPIGFDTASLSSPDSPQAN